MPPSGSLAQGTSVFSATIYTTAEGSGAAEVVISRRLHDKRCPTGPVLGPEQFFRWVVLHVIGSRCRNLTP